MEAKKVGYAALGAPVSIGKAISEWAGEVKTRMQTGADGFGKAANEKVDVWAVEGEKVYKRIADGKVVDEIAAKVDLDSVQQSVSKLRDQLENMLTTWKSSFRPEKVEIEVENAVEDAADAIKVEATKVKPEAKKPAASKPASAKPATPKPATQTG
jgi:gas vesicle protein